MMDGDLKYIVDEEKKFSRLLDDARREAREKVERHRASAAEYKKKEIERITSEYGSLTENVLNEIRSEMESGHDKLRRDQELLLEDTALLNKITGRIVTLILENR